MAAIEFDVRRGAYYDSVVLMQLQRSLLGLPGVMDAGVVMATQANCNLLAANNLLPEPISPSPDDLLIVVKADSENSATYAIGQVDELLTRKRATSSTEDFRPRSMSAAARQLPESNWVLISVPGRYAAGVAREALELNKHIFLYSDNVSIEDEIGLKKAARDKGLLVMGPDCGTAIINGIGFGFSNRVRRGSIGLVGASGTGLQAVTTHIHNLGAGISHALGTGSRDLKSEVGAITALQALDLLSRDAATKVIVLISKPPSPDVATTLISAAQGTSKSVIVYFIGYALPARAIGNLHFAASLHEAAKLAVSQVSMNSEPLQASMNGTTGYIRGLFSGGTLAYETLLGLQAFLSPIYSNAPITSSQTLKDPLKSEAHTLIDLGDEYFMVGRLHPMIDNDLRIRRMRQEADDPEVGMILFDVVLGEGAHVDPAGEIVPAIQSIRKQRQDLMFAAIVIGTEDDPQNIGIQEDKLKGAGVTILHSTSEAVDYVSLQLGGGGTYTFPPVNLEQLEEPLAAINVGLESFYESLIAQKAQAVQVEWRPPAGGNEKLAALLQKMRK
jgi:FdrA protein